MRVSQPTRTALPHAARAGLVSRFAAFFLDWVILSVMSGLATGMMHDLFDLFGLQLFSWGRYTLFLGTVLCAGVLSFFSLAVLWHLVGWSPGKALVGLRVIGADGRPPSLRQATLRLVGYWISALPMFAGFLWCLVDGDRQTWHDKLSRTYVVYAPARARTSVFPVRPTV